MDNLETALQSKGGSRRRDPRRRRDPPRRRRTPSPTPWPTPYPTPYPTPMPTPRPTPMPTPPPTRIPTPTPTPPPTAWYNVEGADVSPEQRAVYSVVDMLAAMLKKVEKLLASGGSEDRLGWCEEMHKAMEQVKVDHAYVDQDPHKWALNEVTEELDWLCVNWNADRKEQIPEHAQMVKEVLEMYEEKLTCFPGDVYCSPQGKVAGLKPDCHCVCNAGWTGEACHEAAEGNPGLAALTPLAECLVTNSWRSHGEAASMSEDEQRNTVIVELSKKYGTTVPALQGLSNAQLVQRCAGFFAFTTLPECLVTNSWRSAGQVASMSGDDQRNTVIVELNNRGMASVGQLQGMGNGDLVSWCSGLTALSQCLVKNSWRSAGQVASMSADDQRNTVIVELNNRGVASVGALQGMSNNQLGDRCSSCADVSGSWVDNTGGVTVMKTDASWTCGGGAESGAWSYSVYGSTVTLSDGTRGTISGTAPQRTISWSNGFTYTEQSR